MAKSAAPPDGSPVVKSAPLVRGGENAHLQIATITAAAAAAAMVCHLSLLQIVAQVGVVSPVDSFR